MGSVFQSLSESVIRDSSRDRSPSLLKPAGSYSHLSIEIRNIRLDVQKRCAVENVHVPNVKYVVFDLVQLDDGKPDWVWTLGRTGGKESTQF